MKTKLRVLPIYVDKQVYLTKIGRTIDTEFMTQKQMRWLVEEGCGFLFEEVSAKNTEAKHDNDSEGGAEPGGADAEGEGDAR